VVIEREKRVVLLGLTLGGSWGGLASTVGCADLYTCFLGVFKDLFKGEENKKVR